MVYKVVTHPRAERDIADAYFYIAEEAPDAAVQWYRRMKTEIASLAEMPLRFGTAPEAEQLGIELRQMLVGQRSAVYRIIFRIDEGSSTVHILAVRHGARKPVDRLDIE